MIFDFSTNTMIIAIIFFVVALFAIGIAVKLIRRSSNKKAQYVEAHTKVYEPFQQEDKK